MIYDVHPKFVFVHIPKTGGTSIEKTLVAQKLGKNLNEITAEDASLNFLPRRGTGYQHSKLRGYAASRGGMIDDYFKFAFVRNPWDLVLSEIFYFRQHERKTFNHPTIRESIICLIGRKKQLWGHDFSPQVNYLKDELGSIRMDFIGRFENLQDDFDMICERIDVPRTQLPHIFNTGKSRGHYSEYYDDETREMVAEKYAADIAHFGYMFENKQEIR